MKSTLLLLAAMLTLGNVNAQYSQNFEGTTSTLSGDCWTLTDVHITNNPADVITGNGSLYSNPPTNNSGTRDFVTPALKLATTSLEISFNYKPSSAINGNATRTIEIGVEDALENYTILHVITMDKFSPSTVQSYNGTFTVASAGVIRLVIKLGGSGGDGNSRTIIDDLYTNASPLYGAGSCNSAPVAVNDAFTGVVNTVISGNIMLNDNDPNDEAMVAGVVANSPDGVLVLNANGSFTFTPNPGFTGPTTSFTYSLLDNGYSPMSSNVATVTLTYVVGGSLPVSLVSFNAMLGNNNRVNLSWTTASELNVSHFVIEKSTNGSLFTDAGTVFAAGNSTAEKNYGFVDLVNGAQVVIYYRLRSVDFDGKSALSQTRIIRLSKSDDATISVLTFPNPVISDLRVTIPANWQNKKVLYEVFQANGAVVLKSENNNSSQTETLNMRTVAPGLYIVKVSCNGQTSQQKIIKY